MPCGGNWRRLGASRLCVRLQLDHRRSDRCEPSWKPPSENARGFSRTGVARDQRHYRLQHRRQRGFTRQRDLRGEEVNLRSCRIDLARFRSGFIISETRELHDFGGIHATAGKHGSNLPNQIKRQGSFLEPLGIFEVRVARKSDPKFISHRPNR